MKLPYEKPAVVETRQLVMGSDSGAFSAEAILYRLTGKRSAASKARRLRHDRKKYGIKDPETYDLVFRLQNGICAICPQPATRCDHDHETGLVRGALCNNCNSGIGMLGDDVERLKRAIEYLNNPPTNALQ